MPAMRMFLGLLCVLCLASAAEARGRRQPSEDRGGVPNLNVQGSCADAQRFSSGGADKNVAYKGCLQDEMNAKDQLAKKWPTFHAKDRQTCVEQARFPSPSYVEVLTCLEMYTDAMANAHSGDGRPSAPQIGGPVAPGLSDSPGAGPPPGPSPK